LEDFPRSVVYVFSPVASGFEEASKQANTSEGNTNAYFTLSPKIEEQFRITGQAFVVDSMSSDAVWLNEKVLRYTEGCPEEAVRATGGSSKLESISLQGCLKFLEYRALRLVKA